MRSTAAPTSRRSDRATPTGRHGPDLAGRAGRDGRLLGARAEQAGHHRRGQGRSIPTCEPFGTSGPGVAPRGDHRRRSQAIIGDIDQPATRSSWTANGRAASLANARPGTWEPDAAPGRRPDRHHADHRRGDQPELRRDGVRPLRIEVTRTAAAPTSSRTTRRPIWVTVEPLRTCSARQAEAEQEEGHGEAPRRGPRRRQAEAEREVARQRLSASRRRPRP